ncbi:hypothetical protein PRVXT_002790 [Proteinivorax tanatarense]|uniref:Uncharacterized protein n=1 Tax=Proteinivorax tanatarense TaxID=1260629 RepID=A0AAU7VLC0_9FIRM
MATIISDLIISAMGFFLGLFFIMLNYYFSGQIWGKTKIAGGIVFILTGLFQLILGTYTPLFTGITITMITAGLAVIIFDLYIEIEEIESEKISARLSKEYR